MMLSDDPAFARFQIILVMCGSVSILAILGIVIGLGYLAFT